MSTIDPNRARTRRDAVLHYRLNLGRLQADRELASEDVIARTLDRMDMRIDEPGHYHFSAQIEDLGFITDEFRGASIAAHEDQAAVAHGERLRPRLRCILRVYRGVAQHQVGAGSGGNGRGHGHGHGHDADDHHGDQGDTGAPRHARSDNSMVGAHR